MPVLPAVARIAPRLPGGRAKVRAGRALAQAAIRFGADPTCRTVLDDGSVLDLDARSRTEAAAVWQGTYEPEYRSALTALLERTDHRVYYDVGANVGLLAVPIARHLVGTGQAVCFEPVARNATSLAHNIELNGLANCTIERLALGAEPTVAQIVVDTGYGAATGNAVLAGTSELPATYRSTESVRIERLDDRVRDVDLPLPDVVKLDVEGSEVGFLRGAADTVRTSRPVILGEFNSALMPGFGATFLDAAAALPPEYAIFSFAAGNRLEQKRPVVGLGDVLLVPREKLAVLSAMWDVTLLDPS